jgi:hypothetical protein
VNQLTAEGDHPLHLAARLGFIDGLRMLLAIQDIEKNNANQLKQDQTCV